MILSLIVYFIVGGLLGYVFVRIIDYPNENDVSEQGFKQAFGTMCGAYLSVVIYVIYFICDRLQNM